MKRSRPIVASWGNVRGNALDEESVLSCALSDKTRLRPTEAIWGKSKVVSRSLDCTKSSPPIELSRGMLTEVSCALELGRTVPLTARSRGRSSSGPEKAGATVRLPTIVTHCRASA